MIRVLLSVLVAAGFAAAQDETAVEKPPPREVRFLAVGDMPPFRQEVRDGVRIQLKAPPGSIPPRSVAVSAPKPDGEEEAAGESRLQIGRVSAPLEVPGGEGFLMVREGGDGEEGGAPWLRVPRPEDGDFLVILWRDPEAKSWAKAKVLVIPENRKAGLVTFVNVAPGPIALVYGGAKIGLKPGRILTKALPEGRPVEFQAGISDGDGGLRRITRQALQQHADDRTLMVFSRADGEKPRMPVKLTEIREAGNR